MQTLGEVWDQILLQYTFNRRKCWNRYLGWAWGGVFRGTYENLKGRMERLACEKKDTEGSGEQEDRQTGEKTFFFFCLCIIIPHIWEKYQGWSVDADCSWSADRGQTWSVQSEINLTQTPSALRVHGELHHKPIATVWDRLNRTTIQKGYNISASGTRKPAAMRPPVVFCLTGGQNDIKHGRSGRFCRTETLQRSSGREVRILCCENIAFGTFALGLTDVSWCQAVTSSRVSSHWRTRWRAPWEERGTRLAWKLLRQTCWKGLRAYWQMERISN